MSCHFARSSSSISLRLSKRRCHVYAAVESTLDLCQNLTRTCRLQPAGPGTMGRIVECAEYAVQGGLLLHAQGFRLFNCENGGERDVIHNSPICDKVPGNCGRWWTSFRHQDIRGDIPQDVAHPGGTMKQLIAILLLALLAACGGSSSSTSASTSTSTPSSNWDEMNWDEGDWS